MHRKKRAAKAAAAASIEQSDVRKDDKNRNVGNVTPDPKQREHSPANSEENAQAAAEQLLRESVSPKNTPVKIQIMVRGADKSPSRPGGGKLKRPSNRRNDSASSRNRITSTTMNDLQKLRFNPSRSGPSDDTFNVPESPDHIRASGRAPIAKQLSETAFRTGEQPSGPSMRAAQNKRAAEGAEADEEPQSKKQRTSQISDLRSQKGYGSRKILHPSMDPLVNAILPPFSMAATFRSQSNRSPELGSLSKSRRTGVGPLESDMGNPMEDNVDQGVEDKASRQMEDEANHQMEDEANHQMEDETSQVPEDDAIVDQEPTTQAIDEEDNEQANGDVDEANEGNEDDTLFVDGAGNRSEPGAIVGIPDSEPNTEDGEADDDMQEENYDALPLYGQGLSFGLMFRANKEYRRHKFCADYYDTQGAPSTELQPKARVIYEAAQELTRQLERRRLEDLEEDEIELQLDHIIDTTNNLETNKRKLTIHDKLLIKQIHAYVSPALVDVLQGFVDCACGVARDVNAIELQLSDVQAIDDLISCILSLHRRWEREIKVDKASLLTEFCTTVLQPLQDISTATKQQIQKLEKKQRQIDKHEMQVAASKARHAQLEIKAKQAAFAAERRAHVSKLIFSRQQVERDTYLRRDLHSQPLRPVDPTAPRARDIDANGNHFNRVGMFGRSRRDEPVYQARGGEEPWTDAERIDLQDALRTFSGPKLWENTFKHFCGPNGSMRYRTASEMLRQAKYMRDTFIYRDEADGRVTEDWITEICDLDLLDFL